MLKGLKVKVVFQGVEKPECRIKIKYDGKTFKMATDPRNDGDELEKIFRKEVKRAFGKKNARKIINSFYTMFEDI